MEQEPQNKNGETQKKIELTPEGHIELLNKVAQFKIEERDMSLDRYRRIDENMVTTEEVFTMSKSALGFLNAAANASNTLNDIVKEMGKIIHKTEQPTIVNNTVSDDQRKFMAEQMQEMMKSRRNRRQQNENASDETSENES